MKAQSMGEFRKELSETERLGCQAVRNLCGDALELWGKDREMLADLADIFVQAVNMEDIHLLETGGKRKDDGISGTYLMLYHTVCDYARNHLSQGDYHYFCERQTKKCGYIF